jgi:hypothetical protein
MPILTLHINDWFYRLCRSFPKMDFVKEKFLLNKSIMIFKIAFVALSKLEEQLKLQLSNNFWSYILLKNFFLYDFCCTTICWLCHEPGTQKSDAKPTPIIGVIWYQWLLFNNVNVFRTELHIIYFNCKTIVKIEVCIIKY